MRIVVAVAGVLLVAGCNSAPQKSGGPAITRVKITDLGQQPAHPDHDEVPAPVPGASGGPASAATRLIVDGLTAQGLRVVDVGARPRLDVDRRRATVRVAATHRSDSGRQHTSVYECDLIRDAHGRWRPVACGQSQ